MIKKRISIFLLILINILFVKAYMDIGTTTAVVGSNLWMILLAVFSAITAFLVKYFWIPLKKFFMKFKKKDLSSKCKDS